MTTQITYLTFEQIIAIHEDLVEKYGGSHGVRNEGFVHSALNRPLASFDGQDLYTDLFIKAAGLGHSIILNHPFLDGNKRTGMVAMIIFLELNGFKLDLKDEELVKTAVKIATKELGLEDTANWIKEYCVPI